MAPPKGAKYAQKLKTPDIKAEVYKQYCEHIASGFSKESFTFEHPEISVIWETVENYIKNDPDNFPPIQKKLAEAKSYKKFEQICVDSAEGKNEKANTASLQMIMRNKFGWDRKTEIHLIETKERLDSFCDSWDKARKDENS